LTSPLGAEGVRIEADHQAIRYVGRIDFSDPKAPAFSFPGVTILARFQGASLDILLSDTGSRDYFNVQIDDQEPAVIQTRLGEAVFPVARNLSDTEHTVRMTKRTESQCGIATFLGFELAPGKALVAAPPLPSRKIEFIGDSITCGYGNLVATDTPDQFHFSPENEDADLAWGSVAARALGAQSVLTAYSGRGMFRNVDGTESGTVPTFYNAVFPDDPTRLAWDPKGFAPDVIVINLGTNDFSALLAKNDLSARELDRQFGATYRKFVETLRSTYGPAVHIVCVVGPMLSDGYPPGALALTKARKTISGLVQNLGKTDANLSYLGLDSQSSPYGEDWHPTVATHAQMAQALVTHLRAVTGWKGPF